MKLDKKITDLPLTKSNPASLKSLFGSADMLPMWVADMDFAIAEPIQKALTDRVNGSGFAYEYKPDSFFKAQKSWYRTRNNIEINKEDVLYSPSITSSLAIILDELTERPDGVIIQPPVFMEFKDVLRKVRRKILKNPLVLSDEGHYEIDFSDLEQKAKQENAKVLIFCNPHNPVGRVWSNEEIGKLVKICKESDILLISDEIHKDIVLFGNSFTSLLNYKEEYQNIIVLSSEAKSFNLCSISDSMMIIADESLRKNISKIMKKYNLGRTNALTRVALEAAYLYGANWLDKVVETIEGNVEIVENELSESPINLIKPEGTYQLWLDFRNVFDDSKNMFAQVSERSGVAMNAGHWFGREGALFMRMNIATSSERVAEAIKRVVTSV